MANVVIANTDAGLTAKTLLVADQAATVTGLITYDRDPNPPFAVSANSAKVDNLNADQIDGLNVSDFATASVTWTGSANITLTSKVFRLGTLVILRVVGAVGATPTVGSTFVVPVAAASQGSNMMCYGNAIDISAGSDFFARGRLITSTTVQVYSGEGAAIAGWSTNSPFTWASGDEFYLTFIYEAASAV